VGPIRTITKLLLDPVAVAITGWSESPTPMLHTWVIDIPRRAFVHRFSGGAVLRQLHAVLVGFWTVRWA
jgi:hypothetical protein